MPNSTGGAFVPAMNYDRTGATDTGGTVSAKEVVTLVPGDAVLAPVTGIIVLTKGSAAAVSLAAPTLAQLGTRLTIYAGSAFAHVLTATALIDDGVTGGSKTTATFAAFVGASLTLIAAQAGKWGVESKNVVTIT